MPDDSQTYIYTNSNMHSYAEIKNIRNTETI